VQLRVGEGATGGDRVVPRLAAVDLGPLDDDVTGDDAGRPAQRLDEEVGGLERDVEYPELHGVCGLEHAVLVERVLDDDGDGLRRTDEVGQEVGPAPSRHEPERNLGEADEAGAGRQRAIRTHERDLEAATHRRTVDERERRDAHLTEAPESLVPQRSERSGLLDVLQVRDAGEVGSDGEDERLAGHSDGHDLARRCCCLDGVEGL